MTSVAEVLAERGLLISEDRVAAELRVLLGAALGPSAAQGPSAALSAQEDTFLAGFGGVPAIDPSDLAELEARSGARAVAEAARSLSRRQVADLLGIDQTRVSHRTRGRELYSYPGAAGRPRYPDWQFHGAAVVPHLAVILHQVPPGTHPLALRAFMTTPDDSLLVNGVAVGPTDWLTAGGPPEAVSALAATLGEQA